MDKNQALNTSNDAVSELKNAKKYEDCLPCKITGALAFGGLGGYALREANKLNKVAGKSNQAVGLGVAGVVFISAGLYRLML
ncbi:uncharacterized protein BYT42DRAFT_609401 [Radiomyces spectabilis]|uniref:uncharacterized protein n=1 Tax=Radiomyces spectabilis TaxID=64574 RepID=UPI002220240D|nr:uncharacterized protein BYT42DRAFT_609401 [Radiomyces spectabilis]KAI8393621.1 hypothetical protein BYT42DRAFT_609401 [Radiomyces spectabilis]